MAEDANPMTEEDSRLLAATWDAEVPATGQALTVQGELVRAAARLRSEAFRNGNANWDGDRNGYGRLHRFLRRTLRDRSIQRTAELDRDLRATGRARDPEMSDEVWRRLGHAVAEWLRANPQPIPREIDRDLTV